MKAETARETMNLINGECAETITKVLSDNLGYTGKLESEIFENYAHDFFVEMKGDVTELVTGNKMLRQMFKRASICIGVNKFECEDDTRLRFNVKIDYDHEYIGGSNGLYLMEFIIRLSDGVVEKIRK